MYFNGITRTIREHDARLVINLILLRENIGDAERIGGRGEGRGEGGIFVSTAETAGIVARRNER